MSPNPAENPSSPIQPVHTAVPGRARVKIAALRRNAALCRSLAQQLHGLPGMQQITANPVTGSLLIRFDRQTAAEEIFERIEAVFDSISPRPQHSHPSAGEPAADPLRDAMDAEWHRQSASRIIDGFHTDSNRGLISDEAAKRLTKHGPNRLPEMAKRSGWQILGSQVNTTPMALLGVAVGLSIVTGALIDAVFIGGVIAANALIGFATESQTERTLQSLSHLEMAPARVLREGKRRRIPAEAVVPGDILLLQPGAYVAADARLIETEQLSIDESSLTGENFPVEKQTGALKKKRLALSEMRNIAFTGSVVTGGSGKAVVVATGRETAFGHYRSLLHETRPPAPPITQELAVTSMSLTRVCLGVAGGIFVMGLVRGFGFLNLLRTTISLIAASIPEGLPASATATFAIGVSKMKKRGILIRNLPAVETLGAVQTICLDKTGTITQNRMRVDSVFTGGKRIERGDDQVLRIDGKAVAPDNMKEFETLLEVGILCSQVRVENNGNGPELIGSPTENALIELAFEQEMDVQGIRKRHRLISIDFRSEKRRLMATVHRRPDGRVLHAIKGSPIEVLQICDRQIRDGKIVALTDADRQAIFEENDRMAESALRVLGTATRTLDHPNGAQKKNGFVWVGLIGMADPIRPGVEEVIRAFHRGGIKTVMVTGDQALTAETVARKLRISGGRPIESMDVTEFTDLTPAEMTDAAERVQVYSRVSPGDKLKIVQALQAGGNVVAMTGDGINDGPALRAADIGIAMSEGETELVRDVADAVLTKDHLDNMIQAVRYGRTTYCNIRKSVHFFLSTNLTEIMLMATAVTAGAGSPLTSMQLLWINVISDIVPGLVLSLEPPEIQDIEGPPRPSGEPLLSSGDYTRMFREATVITGHSLAIYLYGLLRHGRNGYASTMAFHSLTLSQLLHAFGCRSTHTSIFAPQNRLANPWLKLAVFGSIGVHLLTFLLPGFRNLLRLTPISRADTARVMLSAVSSLMINEAIKTLGPFQRSTDRNESPDCFSE